MELLIFRRQMLEVFLNDRLQLVLLRFCVVNSRSTSLNLKWQTGPVFSLLLDIALCARLLGQLSSFHQQICDLTIFQEVLRELTVFICPSVIRKNPVFWVKISISADLELFAVHSIQRKLCILFEARLGWVLLDKVLV